MPELPKRSNGKTMAVDWVMETCSSKESGSDRIGASARTTEGAVFQPEWQEIVYIGSVQFILVVSIAVLYRFRRRAPRACWLGIVAYGGLLLFNSLVLWAGPLLVYHVQTGEAIALMVWRWQFVTLLSAVVQMLTFGVLTTAILTERTPPHSDTSEGD